MKCFYHNDLDGHCSGAIVKKVMPEIDMFEIDYKDPFPIHMIESGEKIILVDYSLPNLNAWDLLFERTSEVIWIDHHKTAIDMNPQYNLHLPFDIHGLRYTGHSAAYLTWCYFI